MTKNLETADTIVKLSLSGAVLFFYFTKVITGPVATVLMLLAVVVILIFVAKIIIAWTSMD